MSKNIIEIKNLSKIYSSQNQKVIALNKISVNIQKNTSNLIIGPSGSGKTTLLQIIGGLEKPTSGSINVNGQNLSSKGEDDISNYRNQQIGFVFQFFNLQEYLTVLENVTLPSLDCNISKVDINNRAIKILKDLGLKSKIYQKPSVLSGGEKQRVAIARALINKPKILLADEPTGNLDSRNARKVIKILQDVQAQGVTLIIITHDNSLKKEFENVIKLKKGKIN